MKKNIDDYSIQDLVTASGIDPVIVIGPDNKIKIWNNAATIFFNISEQKALNNDLKHVLPSTREDDELLTAIHIANKGEKGFLLASDLFLHRLDVETQVIPLQRNGIVEAVMLTIHDISRHIAKQKELGLLKDGFQNQVSYVKNNCSELSNLSHIASQNLKDLLTSVELMIKSEAKTMHKENNSSFMKIKTSLNRISLLLNDIITLTQINALKEQEVMQDMEKLVKDVVKALGQRFSQKIILTMSELGRVRAHLNQVVLMLQHIFSNIVKFNSSTNPAIHMASRKADLNEGENPYYLAGQYYLLSIVHNGNGFEPTTTESFYDSVRQHGEQPYNSRIIDVVIATKVMEAHRGLLVIEKNDKAETVIKCYFPAEAN